jgi:AmpE protein
MSNILLAALVVMMITWTLPDLARLRDFSWLRAWLSRWQGIARGDSDRALLVLIVPILLVVVCALVHALLTSVLFGLAGFAFAVAVLWYCWGPRELETDIDAVLKAPDRERRVAAAQALRPDPTLAPLPFESGEVVEASFRSALARWFGVLFWFVLLGPAGAIGYRVVQLMARNPAFSGEIDEARRALLERCARILDWAPAHLVSLGLALVSDFDAVLGIWRNYHTDHGKGWFTLDLGFFDAVARAGVDADISAGDGYATDISDPLVELADARRVLRRVLVVWLVVIAILVLAGWVH